MLGVLDSCILLPDTTATELGQRCTRAGGSASALIEATLTPLEPLPSHTPAPYRLGYTLQAPLLQLFRPQDNDWVIDQARVARLGKLIWAPPGLQELVCVTLQEAGLQSYIRPVVQAGTPAGPDGFR